MGFFDWLKKGKEPECSAGDTFALDFEFNTKWVSLDYGKSRTADVVRKMKADDTIQLSWSDEPFRDGEQIRVLDAKQRQIGWVPVCVDATGQSAAPYRHLVDAMKAGWSITAKVKRTGRVDDPTKDIWWCAVYGQIHIPFQPTDTIVYSAMSSNRYHLDPDCGTAKKIRVPLQFAEERGRVPCPKCVK